MGFNTFLMTDFYKTTHLMQFSPEITHLTSYLTPRGSRFKNIDKMVWFGVSGFVHKYLIENFYNNFFTKDWAVIEKEVFDVLGNGLGYKTERITKTLEKVKELWDLNYLPIEINALPEGTLVPMGVPALEIRTTTDGFAWVGQAIESLLSCSIWHPCLSATVAYEYAKIAKAAYDTTVEDNISWKTSMCDFSMRGQESYESAVASSAAWLTAFYNSSTVDAKGYIKDNYWDDWDKSDNLKIGGLTSTEHSVMTSDFALTGDERETYRRLLTEVYPDVSFAAVCDSYDFWNVLTVILPSLRKEIEVHEGFLGVRHDSAEPVEALCGLPVFYVNDYYDSNNLEYHDRVEDEIADIMMDTLYEYINDNEECEWRKTTECYVRAYFETPFGIYDKVYRITPKYCTEQGFYTANKFSFIVDYDINYVRETTYPDKGMVETIYELFGGTINSKGYKVVNPKLKAVYGDSITIQRAREIYKRLEEKDFAANNVSLGVGSFSMECLEEDGILKPFTRDSFSIAIKATYGRTKDGKEIEIFKDPKGFSQKKSLKGLCIPYYNDKGELEVIQGCNEFSRQELIKGGIKNEFVTYYRNDDYKENEEIKIERPTFADIRKRIDENLEKEGF